MPKKSKEFAVPAKDFVIFKAGTWNGETFTEQDLDNMVKSFNADEPIPIIIGHGSDYKGRTRIPVFGQILKGLKRVGKELYACGVEFNEKLAEWIEEGFYPQRSIELSKDNKKIFALSVIGAAPPAVKGLPGNDEALNDIALQFSETKNTKIVEFTEETTIEFAEMEEVEALAINDTFKSLTEYAGAFLERIEPMLKQDANAEMLMNEVWKFQSDACECLNLHSQFVKKIERIEEHSGAEYSAKLPGWKEFIEKIKRAFNKRKETEMEAQEKQKLETEITDLKAKVKEFAEKERLAQEAKEKADKEAAEAALVATVKTFCDQAVKDNKMTPAMRTTDEPIMVTLAKTNADALKAFQQKYTTSIVTPGEIDLGKNGDGKQEVTNVLEKAAKYVKDNPKEFKGMSDKDAINRAHYLYSRGDIKFV